jgi:uncharacterized protein
MNESEHNVSNDSSVINRERLREIVAEACRPIGPYWPMKTFAYYNPLRDLEHLPFAEAIGEARHLMEGNGFLSPEEYRQFFHDGRITRSAIERALQRVGPPLPSPESIQIGERTIHVRDIWQNHVIYGINPLNPVLLTWALELEGATNRFRSDFPESSRKTLIDRTIRECEQCRHDPEGAYLNNLWKSALSSFKLCDPRSNYPSVQTSDLRDSEAPAFGSPVVPVDLPADRTLSDWLDGLTGSALVETINNQMIKWIAAFVDEGVAGWVMPWRERGFYSAWRELAQEDLSHKFLGIQNGRKKIQELPDDPEETLFMRLHAFGVPSERWGEYLSRHLAQLPGWAGFIRWRGDNPGYPAQHHYPIDPLQYLAVRLFYESEMVDGLSQREWAIKGTYPALIDYWSGHREQYQAWISPHSHPTDLNTQGVCHMGWRLFHLAQFLELTPGDLQKLPQAAIFTLLDWLDNFPEDAHGPVWLEAYEDVYQEHLMKKIISHQGAAPGVEGRPLAQGIFCIDARSESFRRHIEAQGPYETLGYAGFFGVPMSYVAFDSHDHLALCPILLTPKAEVVEVPRAGQPDKIGDYFSGSRWHQLSHHLFHDLKHHPIASFFLVDVLGMFFSIGLAGKTFFRKSFNFFSHGLRQWLGRPVVTHIPVDRSVEHKEERAISPWQLPLGYTHPEQAAFVEGGLRIIGLTKNFGRLVMVCGHGSQSDNNPYFSALDCGACGGSHGDPNARVFAAMANNPEVRRILHDHGLTIPEDTWFLPAKHNTTTDRVTLYDTIDIPSRFAEDVKRLVKDLEQAGTHQALERCQRIPGAPAGISPKEAFAHVYKQSMDWANSRPEWGLSGNAAFIIGIRALTKGLNLGGRVFLHSYDPGSDPDGGLLEKIMTAPLIVGELISLTYYFSAVDPWTYGSGSKVIHNIVSGIGVMLGSQSDLQKGLPLQSVNDGARHYHEPMRLLAIIQAPPDRIESIIQKHTLLQYLFHNQWMNLLALDPDSKNFSRYLPDSTWEPVTVNF